MITFFFGGGGPLVGTPSGEKRSRPMVSSGKPLGHSSTDLCPWSKNYTPERDAGGTRDHFGSGRQCSPREVNTSAQASMITFVLFCGKRQLPFLLIVHYNNYIDLFIINYRITSL